jgi:hypothetical protein
VKTWWADSSIERYLGVFVVTVDDGTHVKGLVHGGVMRCEADRSEGTRLRSLLLSRAKSH